MMSRDNYNEYNFVVVDAIHVFLAPPTMQTGSGLVIVIISNKNASEVWKRPVYPFRLCHLFCMSSSMPT